MRADAIGETKVGRMLSPATGWNVGARAELANPPIDDPVLLSSNHFTVDDDGFIARLAVFLRPHSGTSDVEL